MDWVLAFLLLCTLVLVILLSREVMKLGVELKDLKFELQKFRTRQAKITSRPMNVGTPTVDAKAITTRRDTDDLPLTGRMSMGLHRKKRDFGTTDDD